MRWVRLGLRLAVSGGVRRVVLTATGAALGTLVVLACLAAVSVAGAQHTRAQARTPVLAPEPTSATYTPPPALPRLREIGDGWGGRELTRILVANAQPGKPVPPGVERLPGDGEAVVSPALAELLRRTPALRAAYPQQIIGTIGAAGLLAPDELRVYVGVGPSELAYTVATTGFGTPLRPQWTTPGAVNVFTPAKAAGLAFALFVLVPLGVFLATCTRLSLAVRERRTAALRLLGVSRRQAALLAGMETGTVTAAGALAGWVAFRLLAPVSQGWRLGRLHWYAADATVSWARVGVVLGVTVGYAVAIGVLATRGARVDALAVRRDAPPRRIGWWRVVPMAIGALAAWLAAGGYPAHALGLEVRERSVALMLAVLLVGAGLAPAVPLASHAAAALVARVRRGPVWLGLAAARLRHQPGTAPRVVGSLTVAVFVVGVATGGASVLASQWRTGAGAGQADPVPHVYNVWGTEGPAIPDPGLVATLRGLPRTRVAVFTSTRLAPAGRVGPDYVGPGYVEVWHTDCASVEATYEVESGACVDGAAYRTQPWASWPPADGLAPGTVLTEVPDPNGDDQGTPETLTVPSAVLRAPQLTSGPGIVVTTRGGPAAVMQGDARAIEIRVLLDDTADRDAVDAAVLAAGDTYLLQAEGATNFVEAQGAGHRGLDADLAATVALTGLAISLLLGVASFVVASVDRATERRRQSAALAVLGVPHRTSSATEVAAGTVPLVAGLAGAVLAGTGLVWALARLLGAPGRTALRAVGPTAGWALAVLAAGVLLVALPTLLRHPLRGPDLRRE